MDESLDGVISPAPSAGNPLLTLQLIQAIRHQDTEAVKELLARPDVYVNLEVEVESYESLPQEEPLYPSTALVEACRTADEATISLLIHHSNIDLDQKTVC